MIQANDLKPLYTVSMRVKGNSHLYSIEGGPQDMPSVSAVLNVLAKPYLVPWAKKEALRVVREGLEPLKGKNITITQEWIEDLLSRGSKESDRIKDEAADVGTRCHAAIDALIKGQEPVMDHEIVPCVEMFLDWKQKTQIEFILGDTKCASKTYLFGGALDFLCKKNGLYILGDLKTSNYMSASFAYQVGAYSLLLAETYGIVPAEAFILRVGKTESTFEVKKIANLRDYELGFLQLLDIYRRKKPFVEWRE